MQLPGERGSHVDPFAGVRLRKAQTGGMEKIAAERGQLRFFDTQLAGGTVEGVADDRMLERGEVHTNLMRAAGVELDFDERGIGECARDRQSVRAARGLVIAAPCQVLRSTAMRVRWMGSRPMASSMRPVFSLS